MFYSASPLRPVADPPPAEDVAQALAAYCAKSPHYTPHDLRLIGGAYAAACEAAGLDVWLVLGQVAHETGRLTSWWSARPRRNPAGIGVTGATRRTPPPDDGRWQVRETDAAGRPTLWARGYAYAAWAPQAVEAHVSRLLWYAHAGPFDAAQQALYDRAAGADFGMPAAARGSAPTVRELGWAHNRARLRGMGWAFPGWKYGEGVAAHANALRGLA